MALTLTPYIHFVDNAEEALEFYHGIFGGEVVINRFGDYPAMQVPDEFKNHVVHASLMSPHAELFISDSTPMGGVAQNGENISLTLSGYKEDEATLHKYFDALGAGGKVTDELNQKPWGANFGMLTDKYGIHWMVNVDNREHP